MYMSNKEFAPAAMQVGLSMVIFIVVEKHLSMNCMKKFLQSYLLRNYAF